MNRLGTWLTAAAALVGLLSPAAFGRQHGAADRETIDRMRDRDLQPERVLDAIGLGPGRRVGEAGASYGYFTFKLARRVGEQGIVYANDIAPAALREIEGRCRAEKVANIRTVLGAEEDPRFPRADLDFVVVFDCLFEFSDPAGWMANAVKYLGPGGRLVIVDPDPSKLGGGDHFLPRDRIIELGRSAGCAVVRTDDSFLKSHMIVVLEPAAGSTSAKGPRRTPRS